MTVVSIVFNDGVSATLVNGQPSPADRFADWTPRTIPIGESANPQASAQRSMFLFRTDYAAAFSLPMITSTGASSNLLVALRLVAWLLNGGTCTVNTGDASAAVYTCCLSAGTTPNIKLSDKANMEYTLDLDLTNTASAAMVCRYGDVAI